MQHTQGCTNFLVSRGASIDGSTMITYAADSHQLFGSLYHRGAGTFPSGTMMNVYEWDTGKYLGQIEQAQQVYNVVGNMNEHQLAIAETTYGGRSELSDSTALIDYGSLIYITLQRAKTAREAIAIMDELMTKYGYYSSGESMSISDPNEVWHLELIGKGLKVVDGKNVNKGAVWVARRVPEGYVGAHANQARITQFPLDDPENCLYSKDVISFAREMGYFNGKDKDFSFCDTYAPIDFGALRYCDARVWSFFNRITDGMDKYVDYAMGYSKTPVLPLFVKPTKPLTLRDVESCMRDHYEDTPMDMRNDIGAGGHGLPYRWRPMEFEVDGVTYLNERAIATQQTGFWFVAQSRSWVPSPVGGILWFGVDDAGTSCLTPMYASATRIPWCLDDNNGSLLEYSATSSFWLFSRVTNFAYIRYDMMSSDILKVIDEVNAKNDKMTPAIDAAALVLLESDKDAAVEFLTNYSANNAQELFDRWKELDEYLLIKYMDGNVKLEENGKFKDNGYDERIPEFPDTPGYNEKWKRAVANDTGDLLKVVETK
ncbi:MAG: C69 family dipeptidase [Rikenellaceae bacterium]